MPDVRYEKTGHVAVITLDRPDAANSLSFKVMREELPAAWQAAKDDRDVRAIVFTGAGERFFCTGVDLRDAQMQSPGDEPSEPMDLRITARQNDLWKPVIAAVNGHCVGGGLMFVGDADIVIVSENARFSNSGVSIGIIAPVGPVALLRKIPFDAVMRMMIMGRHEAIDAQRARRLGLTGEVTPPDKLMERAMDVAQKIASNSPAAVQQSVRILWETLDLPLSEALASSLRRSAGLRGHPDSIEGPRAWAEKREPKWSS
jgi:enoyl-CoA hydratase/carnithine racemase